jgi:DNA-binding CsgD family transcriptional regulator
LSERGGGTILFRMGRPPVPDGPGEANEPRVEPWPFVDRDARLETVLAVLDGGDPGVVVVSGPRGAGRTRLAREAVSTLQRKGRASAWAAGARGAAAIPLGALAHLVPVAGARADPAAAWQALISALDSQDTGLPAVIAIDDAHLLDDLSAALLHKVALTRSASMVFTVLTGAPAPDPVDALWKDGLATRVGLRALTRADVHRLLEAALGGPPESRMSEMLWRSSGGDAVLVRELVQAGHEEGHLTRVEGIWQWRGDIPLTDWLREVVRTRLGDTTEAELGALELLALAGSLELHDVIALGSAEVVANLERRGLIVVEQAARRPVARLAQPLDARVICAQTPHAMAARFRSQLARTDSVRRWASKDPLRIGPLLLQLQLQPHEPAPDADVLARAAVHANAASDHSGAEQLARAALEEGAGPSAAVTLAEALRWQGRPEEAERVGGEAARAEMSPAVADSLAVTRMLNLFFGLGRVEDALTLADRAEGSDGVAELVEQALRLATGEPLKHEDPAVATPDDARPPRRGLWAQALRIGELALLGHPDEALANAGSAWSALDEVGDSTEAGFVRSQVMQGEWMALVLDGQLQEAQALAGRRHEATMARTPSPIDAVAALGQGATALAAGRVAESLHWLTAAAVRLDECDPIGALGVCRVKQAQAFGLLGRSDRATATLLAARSSPTLRILGPEFLLAEAWCAAAAGREDEAGAAALRAAAAADELGQRPVAARSLHTAVCLGRAAEVVDRLHKLAGELGGRLVIAYAAHAAAAALASGDALDTVAVEFQELGAMSLAADASAQAAEAHRHAGHRRRAAASGAQAAALARAAGGLSTPALDKLTPYALTEREQEIAMLAAAGVRNQAIAARLVLSVRTVETHLAHVYDKLGISSRAALRDALSKQAGRTDGRRQIS